MTALFRSTQDALIFAFSFSGQSYDRPAVNRMAASTVGSGNGLAGLDGAAQAGMVRAEVAALGRLFEAVLVARFAPRSSPCQCGAACCARERANSEWVNAVAYLADEMRTTALAGCLTTGLLRRDYVVRYFTAKDARESVGAIADRYGVDRRTAGAHAGKVARFLGDSPDGAEEHAMAAIDERLREYGVVP